MLRDEWVAKETDALAQAALRIVRERTGRLVALIVRIPPDLDADRFREQLDARLRRLEALGDAIRVASIGGTTPAGVEPAGTESPEGVAE